MIVFDLFCASGHRFEAWFRDGAAFDEQRSASTIRCPVCSDADVVKAPTAMHVAQSRRRPDGEEAPAGDEAKPAALPVPAELAQALHQLRNHVEESCDYVGERFAEEARRIHYGEQVARDIYGEASAEEAAALGEEGITVQPLPWFTRRNG